MASVPSVQPDQLESWLLIALREEFPNGEVTILMRKGKPQRILQAFRSAEPPDELKSPAPRSSTN